MREPKLRVWHAVAAITGTTILMVAVRATSAFAASGEQVGENVGQLLGGWARSLYVGIAAVVALIFLMNRKFADLAVFMVAALLVGGFVLVPGEVAGVMREIWQTITS